MPHFQIEAVRESQVPGGAVGGRRGGGTIVLLHRASGVQDCPICFTAAHHGVAGDHRGQDALAVPRGGGQCGDRRPAQQLQVQQICCEWSISTRCRASVLASIIAVAAAATHLPPTGPAWLQQDDELEEPLLEEFKALRRKLFSWQSASAGGGCGGGAV